MQVCLDEEVCLNETLIEELRRVAVAAAVILKAIKNRPKRPIGPVAWETCPHGIAASKPWFCDDCFLELEEALEDALISIQEVHDALAAEMDTLEIGLEKMDIRVAEAKLVWVPVA